MLEHDVSIPRTTPIPSIDDNSETDTRGSGKSDDCAVRRIKRSISDEFSTVLCKRGTLLATLSETALRTLNDVSVPHPELHCITGNGQIKLPSTLNDSANTSALPQHELTNITHTDKHATRSLQSEGSERRTRYCSDSASENSAPDFQLRAYVRSNSNPGLPTTCANPVKQHVDIPLKTCLKKKAKSTPSSPPAEHFDPTKDDSDAKTLRRVKTVDFETATAPFVVLTAPTEPYEEVAQTATFQEPAETFRSKPSSHIRTSCPNTILIVKSGPARPATTHTDVHVIAIAPSRNVDHVANQGTIDPATPTMQTVETDNDCYEVIWDDVPSEHSIRTNRRSSSASHSLMAISSTSARGLQRVNSKLTDWSGTWNAQSGAFKPTIVVFPDSDGRKLNLERNIEDDEDALVVAPPNSQQTSTTPSLLSSRPVSAPTTRSPSRESIKAEDIIHEDQDVGWIVPTLTVPHPDARRVSGFRKLSNLQDDELKFRGHRDSLTLAHSWLISAGGVSPELFAHRDSVSLARKRMHARNRTMSSARELGVLVGKARDGGGRADDLKAGKGSAVQALTNKASASSLSVQQFETQRHIRIVE
jgi:hypothetical protein